MKVVIQVDSNTAFHHEMINWARVFMAIGWEATLWDEKSKPAFDVFDEIKPDLFICEEFRINDRERSFGLERVLKAHSDTQVYTLDEPYYAANSFDYKPQEVDPTIESKILYVNTYPGAEQPTEHILSLCYPVGKHSIKIFDIEPWSVCQYMGSADHHTLCRALCSTQVLVASFDPDEVPECVHNARLLGVHVVNCEEYNVIEFEDAVRYGNKTLDKTEKHIIKHDKKETLNGGTYFHRVGRMFQELDKEEYELKCYSVLSEELKK